MLRWIIPARELGSKNMTRNNFLTLATVVAAAFGLALLFVPTQFVGLYGVKLTPALEVLARIAGSTILAFAIAYWGARENKGADALKSVILAGFVTNAIDCLIMAHATATALVNSYGWGQAAINGALALGFAYFAFGKKKR
jgi:hypothetical protein